MQLKPLIRKVLNAEEISAEERIMLEKFDPDALTSALQEAEGRISEMEDQRLSNEERLQKELDSLKNSYAALELEHSELNRKSRIEKIAENCGCTDPEYLDFRARRAGVDLENPAQIEAFMREVSRTSPGCFRARIVPGSSAGSINAGNRENVASGADGHPGNDRVGRIVSYLDNAPDVR